jgi:hypothetical protein
MANYIKLDKQEIEIILRQDLHLEDLQHILVIKDVQQKIKYIEQLLYKFLE